MQMLLVLSLPILLAIAAQPDAGCPQAPAGMACIPAGVFLRGSDTGPENSRPQAPIELDTYFMDVLEVTYADYKACERAHKCAVANPLYQDFNRPRQAMTGMTWYDAVQYCTAHGKHLPTEAEWEKAARGTDGRLYPWGNEPATCQNSVIMDASGRSCGIRKKGQQPEKGRVLEVGLRPPTQYGLYDMAGNSWEWVADWYSKSYAACGPACLGHNPKGPCDGAAKCPGHREKLVRGGSWYWPAEYATTIYRRPHVPNNRPPHHFGFRCAASVAEAARLVAR